MVYYYDSSILLSFILEEKRDIDPVSVWDGVSTRLSSNLLKIECIVGIRRSGIIQDLNPDDDWVNLRIGMLEQYFNGINFKLMDESIEATVRENASLTRCRALDAVHLATALYFKPHHEETLTIASLDKRMRAVASDLGFKLYPEDTA
jgi:predicted nucleic acid-binding protein